VATVRRRDIRRVLVGRYCLLEVKNSSATSLTRAWHRRFGVLPQFANDDFLLGYSFSVPDGRALVAVKPAGSYAPTALMNMACSLLRAKHGVDVRPATPHETMKLNTKKAGALPVDDDRDVEQFPTPGDDHHEAVVAEYQGAPGQFLHRLRADQYFIWCPSAETLDDAFVWTCAEEANEWLDQHAPTERFTLTYLAVARAETEQRFAAAYDDQALA
jgi:hypothetical protein